MLLAAILVACDGGGGDVTAPPPTPTPDPPPPAFTFSVGDRARYSFRQSTSQATEESAGVHSAYHWEVVNISGTGVTFQETYEALPDWGDEAEPVVFTSEWDKDTRVALRMVAGGESLEMGGPFHTMIWVPTELAVGTTVEVGNTTLSVEGGVTVSLGSGEAVEAWRLVAQEDGMEVELDYARDTGIWLGGTIVGELDGESVVLRIEKEGGGLAGTFLPRESRSAAEPTPRSPSFPLAGRDPVRLGESDARSDWGQPVAQAQSENRLEILPPFLSSFTTDGQPGDGWGSVVRNELSGDTSAGVLDVALLLSASGLYSAAVWPGPRIALQEVIEVQCRATYTIRFEGTTNLFYRYTVSGLLNRFMLPVSHARFEAKVEFGVSPGLTGSGPGHRDDLVEQTWHSADAWPTLDSGDFQRSGRAQRAVIWETSVELEPGFHRLGASAEARVELNSHGVIDWSVAEVSGTVVDLERITVSWPDDVPAVRRITDLTEIGTRTSDGALAQASGGAEGCNRLEHEGEHSDVVTLDGFGQVTLLDAETRAGAVFRIEEDGAVIGAGTGTIKGAHGAVGWDDDGSVFCHEEGPLDATFSFDLGGHLQGNQLELEPTGVVITSGAFLDCSGGGLGDAVARVFLGFILQTSTPAESGAVHEQTIEESEAVTAESAGVIGQRDAHLTWRNTVWLDECPAGAASADGSLTC